MPLVPPPLDSRKYQDLLDEALARIPVHTPEWTNFNASDPGVTLIEIFAHMTESLLYRANQIPERNRGKFLQLLDVPLAPAASARGLITISNDNGPRDEVIINGGLEVLAGDIAFRSERGLDVLPLEARLYTKRLVTDPTGELDAHYKLLYASLRPQESDAASKPTLYETVAFDGESAQGLSLGDDTVDGCLWIALLVRSRDYAQAAQAPDKEKLRQSLREALAGKTLNLGIVPALGQTERRLEPGGRTADAKQPLLRFQMPKLPKGGKLPKAPAPREAEYRALDARARVDVLLEPGVVEIQMPAADEMRLWDDLDPLEKGSGDFPPALDDTRLDERVLTWIRVASDAPVQSRLLWVGINAVEVTQRDRVMSEVLEDGSGEPDQVRTLAHPPVVPGSLRVFVGQPNGEQGAWEEWRCIDDLFCAGCEVRVVDPRQPPGAPVPEAREDRVFTVDAESGTIRFGDGFRGRRPAADGAPPATYDSSRGPAGNLGRGAINSAPALPGGFKVANPVRTWGGAAAEAQAEGEKQIARYLQHRDRLVTAGDFEALALRTPGLAVGRVEVLPAFIPELSPDAPGNAPGAVTLLLIPSYDPLHPDTPEPDRLFLNAVCTHLDPRRLITTELILRGPDYRDLWITVGVDVLALGRSVPEVRDDVKLKLLDFLSPLRGSGLPDSDAALVTPEYADMRKGWPLRKAVSALELMAVASRVPGVRLVRGVRLADPDGREAPEIVMRGLQLPRIAGIAVEVGDARDPRELIGGVPQAGPDGQSSGQAGIGEQGSASRTRRPRILPVPVIPEQC